MHWTIYILQCGDGSFYTGITNDIDGRIAAHESGKGARYTKGRGPLRIIYSEQVSNRSEASKRELAIKGLSRRQKEELVKQHRQH